MQSYVGGGMWECPVFIARLRRARDHLGCASRYLQAVVAESLDRNESPTTEVVTYINETALAAIEHSTSRIARQLIVPILVRDV